MVLIKGIKYACQSCIKGHRSSRCTHIKRQLVEIKKKGRPNSQCDHCRELRKTRSVLGKCDCAARLSKDPKELNLSLRGSTDAPKHGHKQPEGSPLLMAKDAQLLNPCDCQRGGNCQCCKVVSRSTNKTFPPAALEPCVSSPSSDLSRPACPTAVNSSATTVDWIVQKGPGWTTTNQGTGLMNQPTSMGEGGCSLSKVAATPASLKHLASNTLSNPTYSLHLFPPASTSQSAELVPTAGCCNSPVDTTPLSTSTVEEASYFTDLIRSTSVLASYHNSYADTSFGVDHPIHASTDSHSTIYRPFLFLTAPCDSIPAAHTPPFSLPTHVTAACFCGDTCACPECPQHDPFKNKMAGGGILSRQNSCYCGPTSQGLTRTGTAGLLKPCCGGDLVLPDGVSSLEDILREIISNEGLESSPGIWDPADALSAGKFAAVRLPLPSLTER